MFPMTQTSQNPQSTLEVMQFCDCTASCAIFGAFGMSQTSQTTYIEQAPAHSRIVASLRACQDIPVDVLNSKCLDFFEGIKC